MRYFPKNNPDGGGGMKVCFFAQDSSISTGADVYKRQIPIFVSTIDVRENRIKSLSERRGKYELENNWYQYVQGLIESKSCLLYTSRCV